MKKFFAFALSLAMAMSLAACSVPRGSTPADGTNTPYVRPPVYEDERLNGDVSSAANELRLYQFSFDHADYSKSIVPKDTHYFSTETENDFVKLFFKELRAEEGKPYLFMLFKNKSEHGIKLDLKYDSVAVNSYMQPAELTVDQASWGTIIDPMDNEAWTGGITISPENFPEDSEIMEISGIITAEYDVGGEEIPDIPFSVYVRKTEMLHPYDGSGTKIYDDKNGVILWVMNYAGVDGDDDENLGVVVYAVNISEDTVTFVPQNTVINKEEADEFLVHGNEITLLPGTRTLTYLDWDMDGIEFAEVEFAVNYENNPANNTVTKHCQ